MSGSEFDPDQQQDRRHIQPKQELHTQRHQHSNIRRDNRDAEAQQSQKAAGDHVLDNEFLHEGFEGYLQIHGQVNSYRHSQVLEDQARRLDRHSHGEEEQTAVAPVLEFKSIHLDAFMSEPPELTQQANLVTAKTMGELSSARDLATIRSSHRNISGSPNRVCGICSKKFHSGRALGGHMRVHGPLFTQGSASMHCDAFHLAAYGTQKLEEENDIYEDEEQEPASIVDAFKAKPDKDLAWDLQYMESAPVNYSLSGRGGTAAGDPRISCKDGFGDAGNLSMHGEGTGFLRFDCITKVTPDREVRTVSANSTDRKSLLYMLRHNPKRSCRLPEQEFTLEVQQALIDLPGTTTCISAGRAVCSQCGKAFWSERALFGHLRCHPEREWRGLLPPESCSLYQRAMARYRRKRKLAALKDLEKSKLKIKSYVEMGEDKTGEVAATVISGSADNSLHVTKAGEVKDMAEVDKKGEEALDSKADGMLLPECLSFTSASETYDVTPRSWLTAGRRSRRTVIRKDPGAVETSSDEACLTSESILLDLAKAQDQLLTPDCLILLAEAAKKIEEAGTNLQNQHLQLGPAVKRRYGFSVGCSRRGFEGKHMDEAFDSGEGEDDGGDYCDEDAPHFARRERLHKDLVESTCIGGKYECITCTKTFTTHQALGGHRASHKKTKGYFARTAFSNEHLPVEELQLACGRESRLLHSIHKKKKQKQRMPQSVLKGHACSICHRIFHTGQALGGHKRCHWTGDQKPSEPASAASTEKQPSLQSEEQSSKVVEEGIDLNLPAPMDEDDDIGYASAEQHFTNEKNAHAEIKSVDSCRIREPSQGKGNSALPWTVNNLLIGDATSTITHVRRREIEGRNNSFDGTLGLYWPHKKWVSHTRQIPQQVSQSVP